MFIKPSGIATDSTGNVYVTDSGNYRVVEFTADGVYQTMWGSRGNGINQFGYPGPTGIAIDALGFVYVADYGNNRVEKFTSDGGYVTQWGSSGSGNGNFYYPEGIAIVSIDNANERNGNIDVVDRGNNRVEEFKSDGAYVTDGYLGAIMDSLPSHTG